MQLRIDRFVRRGYRNLAQNLAKQERDSRYVFVFIFGCLIFALTFLQALSNGLFDSIERPIFHFINSMPHAFVGVMLTITQLGSLGAVLLWAGLAWYLINRRAASSVLVAGFGAWLLAKIAKVLVHRGRPGDILHNIHLLSHETFSGYGFPSGHATLSAACITVLYYQVAPRYRKYLLAAGLLVGISRMYLGAHFPLDVVGGWALGMIAGSLTVLVMGNSYKSISAQRLKRILRQKGYAVKSLHFANVDARGSRPFFMEDEAGNEYFAKIFGKQEHAADWLFKVYRFFRYKNLQAEEPYMNSKRNVELESLATLWASESGARVAKIVDLVQAGSLWILMQQRLDARPMSEYGKIKDVTLVDAWRQVEKLHAGRLAHRDLRTANLLIDKKGNVWIVDFGFAEVSARKNRMYMDVAELLMSTSLRVGVRRAINAACKVVPHEKLGQSMPYLQKAVFSGATSKQLKQQRGLLDELKRGLEKKLRIEEPVENADILRLNLRKLINIGLLAAFIYIVLPQLKLFSGTLHSLSHFAPGWFVLALLASVFTYIATALIYVSLADVPLKIPRTTLVQLAGSFVTKILPGGLGNTAVNARYLKFSGMDSTSVTALLVSQGAISFLTFIVPLGLFLFFNGSEAASLLPKNLKTSYLVAAIAVLLLVVLAITLIKKLRVFVVDKVTKFITELRGITAAPRDVSLATVAALLVTTAYILCLYGCARAIGLHVGIGAVILVYASAVIAKAAIPTPGGLGPLEVAMVALLVGLGFDKPSALSTVVLYRLITFWLPVPFSLVAYRYLNRKKLI